MNYPCKERTRQATSVGRRESTREERIPSGSLPISASPPLAARPRISGGPPPPVPSNSKGRRGSECARSAFLPFSSNQCGRTTLSKKPDASSMDESLLKYNLWSCILDAPSGSLYPRLRNRLDLPKSPTLRPLREARAKQTARTSHAQQLRGKAHRSSAKARRQPTNPRPYPTPRRKTLAYKPDDLAGEPPPPLPSPRSPARGSPAANPRHLTKAPAPSSLARENLARPQRPRCFRLRFCCLRAKRRAASSRRALRAAALRSCLRAS